MTRALLLALILLLATALSGCLASDNPFQDENVEENGGCDDHEQSGEIGPGRALSVTSEAEAAPAQAHLSFETSPYAGTVDLVLEHEGTEIWRHQLQGVGNTEWNTAMGDLQEGTYTLTATAEQALGQATLRLAIAWGGARCG